jgi:hypothetical protein
MFLSIQLLHALLEGFLSYPVHLLRSRVGMIQSLPRGFPSPVWLGCSNIHHYLADGALGCPGNRCGNLRSQSLCLGFLGRGVLVRLYNRAQLPQDDDAVIPLLKPGAHHLEFNFLSILHLLKVGIANVEVSRQEDLEGSEFGVDSNLTLQSDWHTEDLAGMGHTDIGLELDGIFQPALDEVGAPQGMLEHRDTAGLEISLCSADALILVAELGEKTGFDVALEKFRVDVDIPDESTTFKERITHTACSY